MRIPEQREPEFIINNLDIFSQPEHESYTGIHLEIYIYFFVILVAKLLILSCYRGIPCCFAAGCNVAFQYFSHCYLIFQRVYQ